MTKAFEDALMSAQTSIFVPAPVLWELSMLVEDDEIGIDKPFSEWVDNRIMNRRGKKVAVVAIARLLIEIAYHVLKEKQPYNESKLALG